MSKKFTHADCLSQKYPTQDGGVSRIGTVVGTRRSDGSCPSDGDNPSLAGWTKARMVDTPGVAVWVLVDLSNAFAFATRDGVSESMRDSLHLLHFIYISDSQMSVVTGTSCARDAE